MPIVEVEPVEAPGASAPSLLAQRLADGIGEVFGSEPGHTWVVVRPIPAQGYAENASGDGGYAPVFVRVLKKSLPARSDLQGEIDALTRVVAEVCGRDPSNVHVIYAPPAAGRVAFGGVLME